mmetsp:Transcript_109622/g.306522  ORF Transcript_109622/g.306522 Transcript_109622/m.306522 type:complete len:274 (-) Transcript_109622:1080-1901(-)
MGPCKEEARMFPRRHLRQALVSPLRERWRSRNSAVGRRRVRRQSAATGARAAAAPSATALLWATPRSASRAAAGDLGVLWTKTPRSTTPYGQAHPERAPARPSAAITPTALHRQSKASSPAPRALRPPTALPRASPARPDGSPRAHRRCRTGRRWPCGTWSSLKARRGQPAPLRFPAASPKSRSAQTLGSSVARVRAATSHRRSCSRCRAPTPDPRATTWRATSPPSGPLRLCGRPAGPRHGRSAGTGSAARPARMIRRRTGRAARCRRWCSR